MRITKYKNVYQITYLPHLFPINCYLIELENSLLLVDIGLNRFYHSIIYLCKKLNKPLTKVVLTHAHSDHVGGLSKLFTAFNTLEVYISSREARLLRGDYTLDCEEDQKKIVGSFTNQSNIENLHYVNDGAYIEHLQVFFTPGHTPGSLSLFDAQNKILLAGDLLQTKGGTAIAGDLKWTFPFPALATWSVQTAADSINKIMDLDFQLLCVGHGNMLHNPKAEIRASFMRLTKKGIIQ